jgi:hypothetical protein
VAVIRYKISGLFYPMGGFSYHLERQEYIAAAGKRVCPHSGYIGCESLSFTESVPAFTA